MVFSKSFWRTYEQGIQKEWLLTNGIGGFASSTIIGANARRYHGLLIASLNPPLSRHLVLSQLAENIRVNNTNYNIYSFSTNDFKMNGHNYLLKTEVNPLPVFTYVIADVLIEKTICMIHGKNAVAVVYRVKTGKNPISIKISPLVNFRDFHINSKAPYLQFDTMVKGNSLFVKSAYYDKSLEISCNSGNFTAQNDNYFYGMYYNYEQERALDAFEDHFVPGFFTIEQNANEERIHTVVASFGEEINEYNGNKIISNELNRLNSLVKKSGLKSETAKRLVIAADAYIAERISTNSKTILAGYPWFSDWGRDTMVSLTGLTLTTKRYEDAKEILKTYSKYVKDGLIPNNFPDQSKEPLYNSVDAALWYVDACWQYVRHTGDHKFILLELLESLEKIINCYRSGTLFNIYMDEDYLLCAGDSATQLTWMDAKVGEWIVTPRNGKAVEVNALWYNSLMILSEFYKKAGKQNSDLIKIAEGCKKNFEKLFWNEEKSCLYDVVNLNGADESIRPNQIFALSLSFPIMTDEKAIHIFERVWNELYTAYGLKTLSSKMGAYVGTYQGDQYRRDGAYHQGTVWPWLIGHFIDAYAKLFADDKNKNEMIKRFLEPFDYHLDDACIGQVSEIFDGDEPLIPRGCYAKCWSVSEVLRVMAEYGG